ncbi:hypothetical protein LBMAG42_30490 [Deltaproteobacteria bacterium]|nr:hypothetical protein LBMAG42_30490 [Deltaproteobacteria bacterium]
MDVAVPAGARWSCHACGACCRLFQLGPVAPAVIADLEQRGVAEAWAPAGSAPWYERRQTPNGPAFYLRKVDGACVFLQPDTYCAVHRLYGASAKPDFCQEFPFQVTHDPNGTVVTARGECAGFYASSVDGEPLEGQVAEVLAIPRTRPIPRFAPQQVELIPGRSLPLNDWMDAEARVLAALNAADGSPAATVAVVRHALVSEGPPPDPARFTLATRALLHTLGLVLDHVLSTETNAPAAEARFTAELREVLRRAELAIHGTTRPLSADANRHLNLLLRSAILSKSVHALGGVSYGLGLFLFNTELARLAAGGDASQPVSAREHSDVYTRLCRLTLNTTIHQVLLKARPALLDLFLHAA